MLSWTASQAICWCTALVTKKITAVRAAFLLSLALHAGFGWWALQTNPAKPEAAAAPRVTNQPILVQLLTLFQPKTQAAPLPDAKAQLQSAGNQRLRKSALLPRSESAADQPAPTPHPADAMTQLGKDQTLMPAAAAQISPALNLNLSRTVTSAEIQRRKSPLAAAADAAQTENLQTPEVRAFAKFAPVASGISSETITADGTRLIKFSGGACMRVVNPSSRSPDDIRKPVTETC